MNKRLQHSYVKPVPVDIGDGKIVPGLVRMGLGERFLKQEGESVPLTTYWLRRIRMKDVIKVSAMAVLGDDVAGRREDEAKEKTDTKKSKKGKDK